MAAPYPFGIEAVILRDKEFLEEAAHVRPVAEFYADAVLQSQNGGDIVFTAERMGFYQMVMFFAERWIGTQARFWLNEGDTLTLTLGLD